MDGSSQFKQDLREHGIQYANRQSSLRAQARVACRKCTLTMCKICLYRRFAPKYKGKRL